jgi:hypothetical protein
MGTLKRGGGLRTREVNEMQKMRKYAMLGAASVLTATTAIGLCGAVPGNAATLHHGQVTGPALHRDGPSGGLLGSVQCVVDDVLAAVDGIPPASLCAPEVAQPSGQPDQIPVLPPAQPLQSQIPSPPAASAPGQ